MTIHLKPYEQKDREKILAMLGGESFKEGIWEWQFEQNPFLKKFDPVLMASEDRLLGFNGVMAARVKYGNENVDALWSCDFHVDAEHRGKGLGKRLKERLIEKAPLIMSFGVSPKAAYVLEKMGWRKSPDVFSYRCQRRIASPRDLALALLQLANRLKSMGSAGTYTGRTTLSSALPTVDEVEGLWRRVAGGYNKIVHRTFAYLDWRYQKHPLAVYQFVVASRADVEGIMVVRQHKSTVRLVDYLGPARDLALKRALVRHCRASFPEADSFVAVAADQELGDALRGEGFYRARTRPAFYVRSSIEGDEDCERGWFLMAGDSDGELLSAAREGKELLSGQGDFADEKV